MADDPATAVPYDIEIEQALLGAMILDGRHIPPALANVEADHFYDPLHARIFAQIAEWSETDRAITPLTLKAALKADPGLNEVGGMAYLMGLVQAAPSLPPVRDYARTIRDLALRRDGLAAIAEAVEAIHHSPRGVEVALRPVMAVAEEAERIAMTAKFQSTFDAGMESIRDAERASAGKPVRAVKTGINKLDNETGGFQGADLVIIAGKSGMGKSALMGGISWRAASMFYPVLVISLEMKRKQWVQRLISDIDFDLLDIERGLEYRKFRSTGVSADGRSLGFTAEDFNRLVLANRKLEEWPWLEIQDDDGLSMAQIAARARAFKAKWVDDPRIRAGQNTPPDEEPIGLVIIDYLQLVDPASRQYVPREQEVRNIARGHKALAKNMDWPVVSGSQLNEGEKDRGKDSKRPQAGDVRESKSIFHEADILLAPYRMAQVLQDTKPDAYPGDPAWHAWNNDMIKARHHFDLIGLKNRMGRRFTLELFGDMASSAVRDEEPIRRVAQQAADDLLVGINR